MTDKNVDISGARVLIFQQRKWGIRIGHALAKSLQKKNCSLAAFTMKKSTHAFVLGQNDVQYDKIINHDEILENPKAYINNRDVSLEEICEALGVDSLWPFVSALRHHSKSYGEKYYYSYKQGVTDEGIVEYLKAIYLATKDMYDSFNPDVILAASFVSLPHVFFNLYGLRHGVRMVVLTHTRTNDTYTFVYDYKETRGILLDHLDDIKKGTVVPSNITQATEYISDFRKKFRSPAYMADSSSSKNRISLAGRLREMLIPYYESYLWFRDRENRANKIPSLGVTVDYRPPHIILRDYYANKRNRRDADSFDYYPFDKVGKFVFFPLQFQPEAAIDLIAPYFANQIETARQIAMSLPGDYTLVVKEHPGMVGLRSLSYLEKVARTPNVKLIDYRIGSDKVLSRAGAVVSAYSTTLAEAAIFNTPAILLSDMGTLARYPNVRRHTDLGTISGVFREILGRSLQTEEYEIKLVKHIAGILDVALKVDYWRTWEKGHDADLDNIVGHYISEVEKVVMMKSDVVGQNA